MKDHPRDREPGDKEIRILKDGRVVFIAPDKDIVDVAECLKEERNKNE